MTDFDRVSQSKHSLLRLESNFQGLNSIPWYCFSARYPFAGLATLSEILTDNKQKFQITVCSRKEQRNSFTAPIEGLKSGLAMLN